MLKALHFSYDLADSLGHLQHLNAASISDPTPRAEVLGAIAAALDAARPDIVRAAAADTALTPAELEPEFERMTGTFSMFASAVREGSWARVAIDPPATATVGPNHDLRSTLVPLGPIAVFGASNFPFAYGVCGGDTASALAAGCPVVVKEHPAHIKTGRLLHRLARNAIHAATGDEHLLGYIANENPTDFAPAQSLVTHPAIKAVGFTGSRRGGLALQSLAATRPDPIPIFAEMGSTNPVVITPAAAVSRGAEIGAQLADSILSRFGQQCTCPGIIVVPDARGAGRTVVQSMAERMAAPPRDMLAVWIRDAYLRRLQECMVAGRTDIERLSGDPSHQAAGGRSASSALLLTTADRFAWSPELREEIFGPAAIIVDAPADPDALAALPLPLSLTFSIYFQSDDAADLELARRLLSAYALNSTGAGRIIFNGVPTGVRVAEAMVHGGPFPSSNSAHTTAVGPRAIERWCRPVCWQNCPAALLPVALMG